ncbi:MAG: hypothetical protein Q7U04_18125 [Bacteriovorax sp.]|nr:hypothetical protein [Bacteriovorax sp.]
MFPSTFGLSYRGANLNTLDCKTGTIVNFPGFVSTTTAINVAYVLATAI